MYQCMADVTDIPDVQRGDTVTLLGEGMSIEDMANMLDYIDTLNELDTSGVEPMSHVFPVNNVFREDVVTNGDDREEILANAPEAKEGAFVVPKTFD